MLRDPLVAVPSIFWDKTEVAGRNLGVTLQPPELRGPEDFEAAIAAACRSRHFQKSILSFEPMRLQLFIANLRHSLFF